MNGVLSFLRTIICSGVAFVVWLLLNQALNAPGTILGALLPVWIGGAIGGVIAALFNPRQGIMLAFTCGILLAIGFLYVRHGYADLGFDGNPLITFWPLWFPAAFYAGAYGYLVFRFRS